MKKSGKFFVGTSNITLPGPKTTFPEAYQNKTRLHYYSSLFYSLEVNSSFYKLPLARTLEKWTTEVPSDFRFTLKIWKEITHVKQSDFAENNIEKFMGLLNTVKKNVGCLLIQFPPSVTLIHIDHVETILKRIHDLNKNNWSICIEFRHASWYNNGVYTLLKNLSISLVLHDMPKSRTPLASIGSLKSKVIFLRFHGPSGDYRGSYTEEFLHEYSELITDMLTQGKNVYAYFNNTIGDAFENAQFIRSKVLSAV
jgi:uncharacterized protein YecE (DUF72 family)